MPANLTDVDEFTSPVQVPAGSDDAGLVYLLTAFQALANRTHYLNEAALAKTLQDIFDQSLVATVATVTLGSDTLQLGDVTFDTDGMSVESNDFTISNHPAVQSAVAVPSSSGSTTLVAMYDGTWTPVISLPTGTGVDVGDFTALAGTYTRLGSTVTFAIYATVDTSSWSGAVGCDITLPVAGTISGRVIATLQLYGATTNSLARGELSNGTGNTAFAFSGETSGGPTGVGRELFITGQYRLT